MAVSVRLMFGSKHPTISPRGNSFSNFYTNFRLWELPEWFLANRAKDLCALPVSAVAKVHCWQWSGSEEPELLEDGEDAIAVEEESVEDTINDDSADADEPQSSTADSKAEDDTDSIKDESVDIATSTEETIEDIDTDDDEKLKKWKKQ